MQKNTHLIIGGNGFLGRVLVKKLLDSGKKVKVIDKNDKNANKKVNFLNKNILDINKSDLEYFKDVKTVYHLAAYQYHSNLPRFNQYKIFYKNNVIGTKNIINICKKCKIKKFIYVSTDMVYGIPRTIPIKEDHTTKPIGDYGKTKLLAEGIVKNSSLDYTIIRPRLIIGPGRLGVFKFLFNRIKNNQPVFLIGKGDNKYQMIGVFDCADACIKCAESKFKNKIYNLGSDSPPTVYEEINNIIKTTGSSSKIYKINSLIVMFCLSILERLHISPLKKEQYAIADKNYILDTDSIKKDTKWNPKFRDDKMLLGAYNYFKNNNE